MKREVKQIKIQLNRTVLENVLDSLAIVTWLVVVILLMMAYSSLPEEMPAHYNALGEVDRWGSKAEMWVLPLISIILWVFLSVLERYPHVHNYSGLTEENRAAMYKNSQLLVNVIKNESTVLFSYLTWYELQLTGSLPVLIMPFSLIVFFGSIAFFFYRSVKISKSA